MKPVPHTFRVALNALAAACRAAGDSAGWAVDPAAARPKSARNWVSTIDRLIELGFVGGRTTGCPGAVGLTAAGWEAQQLGVVKAMYFTAGGPEPPPAAGWKPPPAPGGPPSGDAAGVPGWAVTANTFRASLAGMESMMAKSAGPPRGANWHTIYGFVAGVGFAFRPNAGPLPPRLNRGVPKFCFANAHKAVARSAGRFVYCEGYALVEDCPIPVHHGWVADAADPTTAYDVTIEPAKGLAYVGVAFGESYRRAVMGQRRRESGSLIDNYEDGWPLLRMGPTQLAAVVVKHDPQPLPKPAGGS